MKAQPDAVFLAYLLGPSNCKGEIRIISFIDQPEVIKEILQPLGLWEEFQAPPAQDPPLKDLTFDPSYSQVV